MQKYAILGAVVLIISFVLIGPYLISSLSMNHQTSVHPISSTHDTQYYLNNFSSNLPDKADLLGKHIDAMNKSQNITIVNSTCQQLQIQVYELGNKTIELKDQINNDSLKIQLKDNELSLLKAKCQKQDKPCQICKPCKDQPIVCPICADCQTKQLENLKILYTDLFRKSEDLENQIKLCKKQTQDCKDKINHPENSNDQTDSYTACRHLRETVVGRVNDGLNKLGKLSKEGTFGNETSNNIKILVGKVDSQLQNANSAEQEIEAVTTLVHGLVGQLKRISNKENTEGIDPVLKECIEGYEETVQALRICEEHLRPFVRK